MPPERASTRPAAIALAVTVAAFVPLAILAANSHGSLLAVDRPVTDALVEARRDWLTAVMQGLSMLGSRAVLVGLLLGLAVWGALTRRCPRAVLVALIVFAAAIALETALKIAIDRPRPEPALHIGSVTTRAFPSGHATSAAAVYATLAVLFGGGKRWVLAGLVIGAIALTRVYLGVHWLTDVTGGVLIGGAAAAAGTLALRGHRIDPLRCRPPHPAGEAV